MDGRANNSGKVGNKGGKGRPTKEGLMRLAERLDNVMNSDQVLEKLASKVDEGDMKAIQLWMQYRFGMPVQKVEADVNNSGQLLITRRVIGK